MGTNMRILREKMKNRGMSCEEMAEKINIDASTFYRKIKAEGVKFTVGQMHQMVEILDLSPEEATSIFLL